MQQSDVCLIMSSDWHLSNRVPVARSAEQDYADMIEPTLKQLVQLACKHQCPVVVAGDLFDKYTMPAELVNWTMDWLDRFPCGGFPCGVHAVPGQHDLLHHNYEDLGKTSYWTLVKTGRLQHIFPDDPISINGVTLHGFPWGFEVTPCPERHLLDTTLHVAVVHQYVWRKGFGYEGASEEQSLRAMQGKFQGYDAVVIGDNHTHWSKSKVWNNGSLMRRRADEFHHNPCVGLLHRDGSIETHLLDCSGDKWLDSLDVLHRAEKESGRDLTKFIEELTGMADSDLNFAAAVMKFMETKGVNEEVRRLLLNAIGQS